MATENRPATRTVESLGKVLYARKPEMSNQIAGIILSVILVAGGIAMIWVSVREIKNTGGHLPVYREKGMSWVAVVMMSVVGAAFIVGGGALFRWVWSMFKFRLYVCSDGFYYTQGGETIVFGFNEIQLVEETILHERLPLAKGAAKRIAKHLLPTKTSRSYRIMRCDGKEFELTVNMIPRVSMLAGPLTTAAAKYQFEWQTLEKTK